MEKSETAQGTQMQRIALESMRQFQDWQFVMVRKATRVGRFPRCTVRGSSACTWPTYFRLDRFLTGQALSAKHEGKVQPYPIGERRIYNNSRSLSRLHGG